MTLILPTIPTFGERARLGRTGTRPRGRIPFPPLEDGQDGPKCLFLCRLLSVLSYKRNLFFSFLILRLNIRQVPHQCLLLPAQLSISLLKIPALLPDFRPTERPETPLKVPIIIAKYRQLNTSNPENNTVVNCRRRVREYSRVFRATDPNGRPLQKTATRHLLDDDFHSCVHYDPRRCRQSKTHYARHRLTSELGSWCFPGAWSLGIGA